MPCFALHKPTNKHGWITGTVDAFHKQGVYRVLLRSYPYDDNHPWWDQPHWSKGDVNMVRLDDCQIITTEQAILLGIFIPRDRLTA